MNCENLRICPKYERPGVGKWCHDTRHSDLCHSFSQRIGGDPDAWRKQVDEKRRRDLCERQQHDFFANSLLRSDQRAMLEDQNQRRLARAASNAQANLNLTLAQEMNRRQELQERLDLMQNEKERYEATYGAFPAENTSACIARRGCRTGQVRCHQGLMDSARAEVRQDQIKQMMENRGKRQLERQVVDNWERNLHFQNDQSRMKELQQAGRYSDMKRAMALHNRHAGVEQARKLRHLNNTYSMTNDNFYCQFGSSRR